MPQSRRKSLWSISFLCFIVYAWVATSIGPIIPRISEEFLMSPAMAGLIVGLYSIGGLLAFVGGFLSDRFDKALIGSLFLALFSAFSILAAFSKDAWTFGFSLLLMGIFAGFLEASLNSLTADLFPERRGFWMVLLHISWNIGSALGPTFAAVTIVMLGEWRLAYLIPALLLIPQSLALGIVGRNAKVTSTSEQSVRTRRTLRLSPLSLVVSTVTLFYVAAEMGLSNWISSILESQGSGQIEAGLVNGLYWGAMGIGRLCWAPVSDRMGYSRTLLVSSCLSLVTIVCASFPLPIPLKGALWILTGFFLAPIFPTVIGWVATLSSSSSGLLSGLAYSNGSLGAFVSTWSAGLVGASFGLVSSQYVFPFFMALMALDVGFAVRLEKASAKEPLQERS